MYRDLKDFIENRMQMQHVYQPVMLLTLLRSGGEADARAIASEILSYDRTQIDYYVNTTHNMVGKVLRNHGIVDRSKGSEIYSLRGFASLGNGEIEDLIRSCEDRLENFLEMHGDRVFEHRRKLYASSEAESDLDPLTLESDSSCDFCTIDSERVIDENNFAFAIRDAYPVAELHTLVIPKRHVQTYFELAPSELDACNSLLKASKVWIEKSVPAISGFNIGVNNGQSAGQTVPHAHIHLIPRRDGDVENPRGGVRHVIPGKGAYKLLPT
jgi:ATP adenylyltransferase